MEKKKMQVKFIISTILVTICVANLQAQNAYSTPRKYGEYISPYNLELLERVITSKQSAYNQNYKAVLDKERSVTALVNMVAKNHNKGIAKLNNKQIEYINSYYEFRKSLPYYDYSNVNLAQEIYNLLTDVEETIYNWYE